MSRPPLRVAFDVTPIISGRTGIARYVTQLGAALARDGVELRRFAIGRAVNPPATGVRHVRVPLRLVERWWRLVPVPPVERLVGGATVVHATGLHVPPTRLPLVVTVHDLAALDHPELHPRRHVHQQRAQFARLADASVVLAVSHWTANELACRGVQPDKLVVVPHGVTPLPPAAAPAPGDPEPGSYVLAVGETSPRKRYDVLLRALAHLGAEAPRLVLAGPRSGDEDRLRSLTGDLGLSGRVHRVGPVSDASLAGLYGRAIALCFPSVAEGFGLPVLEAMASGVPVIASDIGIVREVANDAAVYVAVDDDRAWATAIDRVCSDDGLRARLSEAGLRRSAEFTWDRAAKATLAAYQRALEPTGLVS